MTDVRSRNAHWCPPHSSSPVANTSSPNFVSGMIEPAKGFTNSLSKIRSFSPLSRVLLSSPWVTAQALSGTAYRSLTFSDSHSVVWRVSPSICPLYWNRTSTHWIGIMTSAANWRTRSRLLYIRPLLKPSPSTKSACQLCSSSASTLPNWSWLSWVSFRPTNLMTRGPGCWHQQFRREWLQQQLLTRWLTTVYVSSEGQCMVRDLPHLLIFH